MNDALDIGMIGVKDAGKTCFMYGMYAVMRFGVNGFTFAANDLDVDLEFEAAWEQIVLGGPDRFPPPSDQNRKYEFSLNYAYSALVQFRWFDYRGNVHREAKDAEDGQALRAYLQRCHSLIILIAADQIDPTRRNASLQQDVAIIGRRITEAAEDAARSARQRPTVTVAITKADLLTRKGLSKEQISQRVRQTFGPLFVEKSGGWRVMICPVTLGSGLADEPETAEIAPLNVHLPVAFAVEDWFSGRLRELDANRSQLRRQAAELGGNFFKRWWNSQELAEVLAEQGRSADEAAEIEKSLRLLRKELLAQAELYIDGVRQDANMDGGRVDG